VSMSRPLAGLAAVAALLSGCGVAGTSFHPGVAAQVGDQTISVARVDAVASSYCSAIGPQLSSQKQVVPRHYLRDGIAGRLTLVAAAHQLAADYGVDAGTQYHQKVAELQGAVDSLPEDQQQAVIEIEASTAYLSGVEQAVGEKVLAAQGTTGASTRAATKAGQAAFSKWFDRNDVTIDPQFGISIRNGQTVKTDTSISLPVGDAAKQGAAATPDQSYASSLPVAHRCG
jgi:hypothetical protein